MQTNVKSSVKKRRKSVVKSCKVFLKSCFVKIEFFGAVLRNFSAHFLTRFLVETKISKIGYFIRKMVS